MPIIKGDVTVADVHSRYVFDPADVQAEMEVTSRVRKAAAEALMEAEEKLKAAEAAQAGLQQQLEEACQLQQACDGWRNMQGQSCLWGNVLWK